MYFSKLFMHIQLIRNRYKTSSSSRTEPESTCKKINWILYKTNILYLKRLINKNI